MIFVTGTVDWFDDKLGYGFMITKEGEKIHIPGTCVRTSMQIQKGTYIEGEVYNSGTRGFHRSIREILHYDNAPIALFLENGLVKWYNKVNGYGFIALDNGTDAIFLSRCLRT